MKIVCMTVFVSLALVSLALVYLLDSTKIITLNGEEIGIHHGDSISSTSDKLQATQKHELDKLQATQKHELGMLQAKQEILKAERSAITLFRSKGYRKYTLNKKEVVKARLLIDGNSMLYLEEECGTETLIDARKLSTKDKQYVSVCFSSCGANS